MIDELESLGGLARELARRARARGQFLVWRAQVRRVRRVVVQGGRVEDVGIVSGSGQGIQLFTEEGRTALGSRDDFSADAALRLLDHTAEAAASAARLDTVAEALPALLVTTAREIPSGLEAFDRLDLAALGRRLVELEREIAARVPGVTLRIAAQTDLEGWRIVRSDGTDVLFAIPRATLRLGASADGDGARHSVGAAVSSSRADVAWDEGPVSRFLRRAEEAARLATRLPDAPTHPAGSYPIVMDYALAKGLAHEAFGHAAEADGFRSSILARDGRFRVGDRVGAEHVSVIDEPVAGDHAWQPYSSNGIRRERATLVDHGVLRDALSDPWSAEAAGVRITGAERAESYRVAPLPRMTNIRIEVDSPMPATGTFEDYGAVEVRDLLAAAGILRRHPRVVYLSGYGGGQVNPSIGDFVFNCKAIYALDGGGATLHKPAIFAGSMFGALGAIREAFGPLLLDAIGTCGKWGQSVPSSGGSHWLLVLDPDPSVRLGGR